MTENMIVVGQHFEICHPDQALRGKGRMGQVYRSKCTQSNADLESLAKGRDEG